MSRKNQVLSFNKQASEVDSIKSGGQRILKISQENGMPYFYLPKRERFNEEAAKEIESQKHENKQKTVHRVKVLRKNALQNMDGESRLDSEGEKSRFTASTRVKT